MKFFLTTAIDYVNSRPHLGTAYEKITADVIARYKRLAGCDVRFLMGNDEHSQNVFRRAEELGQLQFNAEPLTVTSGTERLHEEYYSRLTKKWVTGTPTASDPALWLRRTRIHQYEAMDRSLTTPLPAGTDPLRIHVKEILVEVRGASVGSLFGPAKSVTVRTITTS